MWPDGSSQEHFYKTENGDLKQSSFEVTPPVSGDRLYLVAAAGLEPFRPIYDALSHMGFYSLSPDAIRELQPSDTGSLLKRDGSNLASVLRVLEREHPEQHARIVNFLAQIVPGIQSIAVKAAGKKEMIEFRQTVGGNRDPWRFLAENMSDGTLRALGILTALLQSANGVGVPFVGIEEPEVALHPGAAGVLRDSLRSAATTTQIVVTSHSPDLLDDKEIASASILAVVSRAGETKIGPIDEATRSVLRDRLYTVGELLRLNQLEPDLGALSTISGSQLELFTDGRP